MKMSLKLPREWSLVLLALGLGACSFDLGNHPASCERDADCDVTQRCYEELCIARSGSSLVDAGNSSHEDAGGSGSAGSQAGAAGSGGSAGTQAGTGGSAGTDADASLADAAALDAGSDAAMDAGPDVPPYAACATDLDCRSGETCRVITPGKGVCGLPCVTESDCPIRADHGSTLLVCGQDDRCKLSCVTETGNGPPKLHVCPTDMTCETETGDTWAGEKTCYPK
jgi:hypothetical protein